MATGKNFEDSNELLEDIDEEISSDFVFSFHTSAKPVKSVKSLFKSGVRVQGKNWMSALNKDFKLRELVLLGSHDSAAINGKLKCQNSHLIDQLNWGVRFLDLHICKYNKEVWLFYGEPCVLLRDALLEINQFVTVQPREKVVICLRKSDTVQDSINWSEVKECLEDTIAGKLVSKEEIGVNIREMKGSVVLLAPDELDFENDVGLDFLLIYCNTNCENSLESFLVNLSKGELQTKEDSKLVWVQCRSHNEITRRVCEEVLTVQDSCFFSARKRLYFNIISFSFIDKTHFSLVKEYFLKWNS